MTEHDRVLDAFRNCITEPKCKDCPWIECSMLDNGNVEIPRDLALAVMRELVAQEPVEPKKNDVELAGLRTWDWACPECNCILTYRANYCSCCGRAVKWE